MPDQTPQTQEPRSELASFGEELRREREIRGISLKEIADATKISRRFLEAIERNDHRTLPAPVFTRGFVREYARYLGLSTDEIVNRYNHAAAGDERIEQTLDLQRFSHPDMLQPVIVEPPRKVPRKRGLPFPVRIERGVLLLVLLAAALGSVAWWAMQNRHRWESEFRETATMSPVVAPAAAGKAPSADTDSADVPPAAQGDRLSLTIVVSENSWVTLEADGKTVLNDELVAGDRRTFEAADEYRFRTIGNAAGVTLEIDGVRVPPLGGDGEVLRNRTFSRETVEELRSGAPRTQP